MALTIGELVAYITADDRGFRRGTRRAEQDLQRLQRSADGRLRDMRGRFVAEGQEAGHGFGFNLARSAGTAIKAGFGATGAVLAPLGGLPLTLAAVAATAVAAAPLLVQAGAAIAEVGSAALAAAPMLIALGAAAKIVQFSLAALFAEGSAARAALEPLSAMFKEATDAGSKAAARGIKPLAAELKRVIQPTVTRFMVGVGRAANIVQRRFLTWAKSAEGVRSIRGILEPISDALQRLAPNVSRLIISFTAMLGRIMGVSTAAGSKGAAKALDWLSTRLDQVNKASVQGGLDDLVQTFRAIRTVVVTVVGWIEKLVAAYRMYTTQFGLLADAVSVAAMVFGGPIATIIGGAGLIIRHFDEVKAAWLGLQAAFQGRGTGPLADALQNLKEAAAIVAPALMKLGRDIWTAIGPPLRDIWEIITTDMIPAFAEFARALAPVVAWLIGIFGPTVKTVFVAILEVIKGTLNVIIGVVKVFTAILTGDWGKAWEGIKQITRGAGQIIGALLKVLLSLIAATFRATLSIALKIWGQIWQGVTQAARNMATGVAIAIRAGAALARSATLAVKNAILGIFRGAGSWLVSAGRRILDGLIAGIRSAVGRVKSELNKITGLIPDWKGPMSVDMRLLEPSGEAIMSGLMDGITGALPSLHGLLGGVTSDIAGAVTAPSFQAVPTSTLAAAASRSAREVLVRVLVDVEGGDDQLKDMVRGWVRVDGGGDVQAALGGG